MTDDNKNQEGYIIEYYVAGKSVKVTAFDPATLREVSIVGTTNASRKHLAELAIRKLHYVQQKDEEE